MDQGSKYRTNGTLPRLSRLPKFVPRASETFNVTRDEHIEDPTKSSHLPRLSRPTTSRIIPPAALGENVNRSVPDKYGWSTSDHPRSRHRSPVRDALQAAQSASLDTTPPSATSALPVFDDGDENATATSSDKPEDFDLSKHRPRPSLTERTLETLSGISPSPSPTRRRASSAATRDSLMGPPARPGSRMRDSRPTTPATVRSASPTKDSFRPPGRSSPTKFTNLPTVPSPGSLFTPPRAFVKGGSARFARSVQGNSRANTGGAQPGGQHEGSKLPSYTSKTLRIKSTGRSGLNSSDTNDSRVALDSIFKEPAKPAPKLRSSVSSSSLLRPRSHGENTIASSPTSKSGVTSVSKGPKGRLAGTAEGGTKLASSPGAKSSATLRETIAKAKAAKKAAAKSNPTEAKDPDMTINGTDVWPGEPLLPGESNKGVLRKRLQGAVTSGTLNLAAMALDAFPDEVITMYETSTGLVGWSEMVDLTKVNMGDNKISHIEDRIFPDWTAEEMYADEDKSNQFAGLEVLDLRNNTLQSIPIGVRRMERLSSLNLNGNKLGNAVLGIVWQIPNLQTLSLSNNDLTGCLDTGSIVSRQIRVLDVSNNRIESLKVEGDHFSNLQNLNISNNKLEDLPWSSLALCPLVELSAASNDLSGVAFDGVDIGFEKLRELDLSRNSLVTFAVSASGFRSLQILKVNGNHLRALPDISNWQELVNIQLSENKLSDMPSIWDLPLLKNADFGQNNIKTLDARIATMEALSSLDISGNPLRDRKFLSMSTADLKLDLEKRLERTAAAENIGSSPSSDDLPTFVWKASNGVLDLSSSSLTSVDPSGVNFDASSVPIHTLRLQNNDFVTLPVELLCHPAVKNSLKSLDISHNPRLHSTECLRSEVVLPSLQSLYVVSTGLTSLDSLTMHLKAPELQEINISCHRLAGPIPHIRKWYPKVRTLLASDNWFSSVDVEGVKGLEVLDVRNNQIEGLPPTLGLLGNHEGQRESGRLRSFECAGNLFRVPRWTVVEKGTEAVLKDLRRRVPVEAVTEEWKEEI